MRAIIQLHGADYLITCHSDVGGSDNVRVTTDRLDLRPWQNWLLHRAYKARGASIERLPLAPPPDNAHPQIVLIYEHAFGSHNRSYIDRLRDLYPSATLAYFYTNPVSSGGVERLRHVQRLYDVVVTFDRNDADEFGLAYHPTVVGAFAPDSLGIAEESDMFFVGLAKDRAHQVLALYDAGIASGCTMDFTLLRTSEAIRGDRKGIEWDKRLPYRQVVARAKASRVIVDINQGAQSGLSLRAWEAFLYGRGLLTNNPSARDLPFAPGQVTFFNMAEEVDFESLKRTPHFPARLAAPEINTETLLSTIASNAAPSRAAK